MLKPKELGTNKRLKIQDCIKKVVRDLGWGDGVYPKDFVTKAHLLPEGRLTRAKPLNKEHKFFQTQPLLPSVSPLAPSQSKVKG